MHPVQSVLAEKRFWRNERISMRSFEDSADTGDLLLFRGKTLSCSLQRSVTRSEYDHVALILRYSSGDLYLFEATGNMVPFHSLIISIGS